MLQTRSGKRTGQAYVKIGVDMVNEGLITKEEAILRVNPNSINQLLHPTFDNEEFKKSYYYWNRTSSISWSCVR